MACGTTLSSERAHPAPNMPACTLAVCALPLARPLFCADLLRFPSCARSFCAVETVAAGAVRRYTEGCESFGPLREGAQAITKAAKFLRDGESCRVVCTGTNGCGSLAASLSSLKVAFD